MRARDGTLEDSVSGEEATILRSIGAVWRNCGVRPTALKGDFGVLTDRTGRLGEAERRGLFLSTIIVSSWTPRS